MKRNYIKGYFVFFIFFLLLHSNFARAKQASIKIGVYQNPPLVFFENHSPPKGLFIDLIQYIAKKEKLKLQYKTCTWSECLKLLRTGKIDILPATGYTRERARWAIFTDEDVIVNWAIVCRRKGTHIDSIPDLNGKSVGILKDDIYTAPFIDMTTAFDLFPRIKFFDSYEEIFNALSKGMVDAGVVNRLYESLNISKFPSIESTPIVFSPVKIKFALTKKSRLSKKLKLLIDRDLVELKQDEGSIYYKSIDHWLGVPEKTVIPSWMYLIIGLLFGLTLSFVVSTLYLQHKVRAKTEELKESYKDLIQMRQYLEAIFHNSPDMIFVHDESGAVVDVNQKVVDTYGYELKDFQDLQPEVMMGKGYTAEMAIARIKEALQGKAQDFEWVACDRKGREFPVEVRLRPFELILPDGSSKRYVLAIVRDISEKKDIQDRINKSEQWFRTIFNEEPECVKIVSPDGRLIDMNPAGLRMIGLDSVESIKGKSCLLIVHEDHREQYRAFMEEVLRGKSSSLEFRIKTFDGNIKWVESHATAIKDETGRIQAVLSVTRDITEKKQLQEELEKKVKERTENLQRIINTMSQRELRMAELKEVIRKLRAQLKEAGLEPQADDPLKEYDGQ